jgi:tRNA dimethylallyltransferase
MKNSKSKIIVILGPTASGKSDAAICLAKAINGEIISADSRQIYRGMNLGTGKVERDVARISNDKFLMTKQDDFFYSEGIRHYMIDVAEPMEDFNVSHFKKQAEEIIAEIIAEKKVPIICGGTGFWIQSITNDTQIPKVAPNEQLRRLLENKTTEELFEILKEKDFERASNIDSKNKIRLIRAIEICQALGKVPSQSSIISHQSSEKYEFLQLGISIEREILNTRIKKRLEDRFSQGMIEEVKNLIEKGVSAEWLERIGLEYRWISRYLLDKVVFEEMKEKLYFDIIHYAKRQMTWFKRDKKIVWIKNYDDILTETNNFLNK